MEQKATLKSRQPLVMLPAQQRDRNVGVYITIPVIFKLKN